MVKKNIGFSDVRRGVVAEAFRTFDPDGSGLAPLEAIIAGYAAHQHPAVVRGDLAPSDAQQRLREQLSPSAKQHDGMVAVEDFFLLHERISDDVDRSKVCTDGDKEFIAIVKPLWGLGLVRLAPTGIVPITTEVPSGVLASCHMDLLWVTESGGNKIRLSGYKNVVKPHFARGAIPEAIQGHFAFHEEISNQNLFDVQFKAPQPAIQPPLSIVWQLSESDSLYGVRDVIVSNIDVAILPSEVRAFIRTAGEVQEIEKGRCIQWLNAGSNSTIKNPAYTTSNSKYGVGVSSQATKVLMEKTQALSGQNPVGIYAGRSGKFTATFAGGMPQASGLNFTVS
mmetsp:Transcript_992/g.1078  ORF Transcript_992/g.1078 Transcript_992/m.1078 type:complete len:338 (+) Transcript_992:21-1034(+)